jgi:chromosomal replication initiator protein
MTLVEDGVTSIPLLVKPVGSPDLTRRDPGSALLPEFIIGPENRLVCVAVESILRGTAARYSPIVLHGPSGVGKSHLALGVAAAWTARVRRRPVLYATALDFARELNDAFETQMLEDFRERYRRTSLFIMEDVGHLAGRLTAQRELVATLDVLAEEGADVLVTASAAPGQLRGLIAPVVSRLTGGLTVPLVRPGPQARLEIVRRLAESRSIKLEEPLASALADGLEGTVPELYGALLQLALSAQLDGTGIDAEHVKRCLAGRTGRNAPSLREIAQATARHFSLKVAELRSSSRRRAVVTARGVAMYLARTLTGMSLQQIGRYFGGRDHTTVSYGCSTTKRLVETEPAIREAVQQLQQRWQVA